MSNWSETPPLGFGDWLQGQGIGGSTPLYSLSLVGASSQYADFGAGSNLNFERTDAKWFSVWVRPTSTNNSGIIAKDLKSGTYRGWFIQWTHGGSPTDGFQYYEINTGGGANQMEVHSADNVAPMNTWTHLVIYAPGTSIAADVKMWVNGVAVSTVAAADTLSATIQTAANITIGSVDGFFDGYITQAAVGSGLITDSDVTTIYNNGTPLNTNNWGAATVISWWPLQNNYTDSVGSNNGSGVNTPTFTTGFYP